MPIGMKLKTLAAKIKTKLMAPGFDFAQSTKLRACIEFARQEISMALFNQENELVYLQQLVSVPGEKNHKTLEHLIESDVFFSQTYLSVYIGINSPLYTLVPKALFQNENKAQWLQFNHILEDELLILTDSVYSADCICLYGVDKHLKELLDRTFPNHQLKHMTTCLAESLGEYISKKHKSCLVHVGSENFDIALLDKKMQFFNSFEYQCSEDFLYFMLASLEQNHFLPEETEIVLAGEIEAQSALHDLIKSYFPKTRFAVTNKMLRIKHDFEKLPNHFHYSLFNLYACAL